MTFFLRDAFSRYFDACEIKYSFNLDVRFSLDSRYFLLTDDWIQLEHNIRAQLNLKQWHSILMRRRNKINVFAVDRVLFTLNFRLCLLIAAASRTRGAYGLKRLSLSLLDTVSKFYLPFSVWKFAISFRFSVNECKDSNDSVLSFWQNLIGSWSHTDYCKCFSALSHLYSQLVRYDARFAFSFCASYNSSDHEFTDLSLFSFRMAYILKWPGIS